MVTAPIEVLTSRGQVPSIDGGPAAGLAAVAAGGAAYMASHWVFGLRLRHLREV